MLIAMVLMLLASCGGGEIKTMSIDEPIFVEHFPVDYTPAEDSDFHCDEIGIKSIKLVDGLLIIGHASNWTVLSADGTKSYGTCLQIGDGPTDFRFLPPCSSSTFIHEGDSLIAYISDTFKKRIMKFNLSKFVESGEQYITSGADMSDVMKGPVWYVNPIDSTKALIAAPNADMTGFERMLVNGDSTSLLSVTKAISDVCVSNPDNINLLSKVVRYSPGAGRVVEGMLYLNQLNVYDTNGAEGRTICVGSGLDDVNAVESEERFARKNGYVTVIAADYGFAGAYSGHNDMEIQTGIADNTELHFFDWDGNPVARVALAEYVKAFDMDPHSRRLLIVTGDDEIKSYDASAIIDAYGQVN